jgi:hypothetical protein
MGASYEPDFNPLYDLANPVAGDCENIYAFKADTASLTDFVPKGKLRRIDHYSRMALLACGKAMKDADPALFSTEKIGVIVATGYGALASTFAFLDSSIEKGDKLASPTHFSNSVHNAAAAHISICYNIKGPSLTVSQFDMSFFSALITARAWLETRKTDAVLIGTTDAYCGVLGYCIQGFFRLQESIPYSFGEGAVFFLVTQETDTPPKYGYFDKITMGQSRNIQVDTLLDTDIIFAPSSIDICNDRGVGALVGHAMKPMKRKHAFSPTDSSMDAIFAMNRKRKTCCLKLGQNGAYGKMMITPANRENE